jgi:hypothetical protein
MSEHYLIDLFTNPVSSAPVVDVSEPVAGQSLINGTFVVRIPDVVAIVQPLPSTLGNLLTKKHAGLLAFYTGYTNALFDDMLDSSGIDFSANPSGVFGSRGSIAINAGTTVQSVATTLATTPSSALFTWEVFTYVDSDPKAGRFTRTYNELPTINSNSTAQVSFNGGSTYITATDSAVVSIPNADQGNSFIVKITNPTAGRLYVGSWSLIY